MKRCFCLTLFWVAMIALAGASVSVGQVQPPMGPPLPPILVGQVQPPIIKPLPLIIIGDTDPSDFDTSSGLGILRYTHALDLSDKAIVDWNNDASYTSDTFHAYLFQMTSNSVVKVRPYNEQRVIGVLGPGEYLNLMATHAIPDADARITSYTGTYQNFWVNLFDAKRHPDITDPFDADPATQGKTPNPAYVRDAALRLVCGVSTGTKLIARDRMLIVKCQSGGLDSGPTPPPPPGPVFRTVVEYTFTGSSDGWRFRTSGMPEVFDSATSTTVGPGTTGIGFIVDPPAGDKVVFSSWLSPANIPCRNSVLGLVYRATAKLESTSTTPDLCPGWRLRFQSVGFAHFGYVVVDTLRPTPAPEVVNVPYAGYPFTAKLFWAPRPDLGDMGDGEGQSALLPGDAELRAYRLAFDVIGTRGDVGILTMEEVIVEAFARPPDVRKSVAWGQEPGSTRVDDQPGNGGWRAGAPFPGFATGGLVRNSDHIVMNLGNGHGNRYAIASVDPLQQCFWKVLKAEQDHLYRFSMRVSCDDPAAVPTYRVNVNSLYLNLETQPWVLFLRPMQWGEFYAASNILGGGKNPDFRLPGQVVAPGAPSTEGTVIDLYVYSHNVASQGATLFHPILTLVDVGRFERPAAAQWPDPVTKMKFRNMSWEDLGPEY